MQARLRRIARCSRLHRPCAEALEDRAHPSGMSTNPILGIVPPVELRETPNVGSASVAHGAGIYLINSAVVNASATARPENPDFQDLLPSVADDSTDIVASPMDRVANDILGITPENPGGGASVDFSNPTEDEASSTDWPVPSDLPPGLDGETRGVSPEAVTVPGLIRGSATGMGLPPRAIVVRQPRPLARGLDLIGPGKQHAPSPGSSRAPVGARVLPIPTPQGGDDVDERRPEPGWADWLKGSSAVDCDRWDDDLRQFLSRIGVGDSGSDSGGGGANWRFGPVAMTLLIVTWDVAYRRGRRARGITSGEDSVTDPSRALTGPWPLDLS
jgi:hypothetical protein